MPDPDRPGRELPTDIWYPAQAGSSGDPAEHPFGRPHAAVDNLPGADIDKAPLLAFSHGNSGVRRQSTFLTTHLASWGAVVVAPDHSGNTFFDMLNVKSEDDRQQIHFDARKSRPRDLERAIEAAINGGSWPAVDERQMGVIGHSYGGWTAFKMPGRDARIRAVCGLAPASEPFVGRKAFDPGELPLAEPVASMIVAGREDVLVDLETSVRPLFDRLDRASLVVVDDADHFHFCDGIELLHGMHFKNVRPNQPRPTPAWEHVLPEDRAHRLLNGTVAAFFARAFAGSATANAEELRALDPALGHHDQTADGAAA